MTSRESILFLLPIDDFRNSAKRDRLALIIYFVATRFAPAPVAEQYGQVQYGQPVAYAQPQVQYGQPVAYAQPQVRTLRFSDSDSSTFPYRKTR